ncbi:hypothetical protein GN958_ATG21107 [Phytophthora infestans]|uniref:Uncharacterized protein n=1 Tax=Phytophthora infestans TaxID=4787 RepID=A0A8S9TPR0_PHYIN|nr:hypothetical protein GN958_ATG21107 [Phytophthora infestans]
MEQNVAVVLATTFVITAIASFNAVGNEEEGKSEEKGKKGRPVELTKLKMIAVCMNYLATGSTIDAVLSKFGIAKYTGVVVVNTVLEALRRLAVKCLNYIIDENGIEREAGAFEQFCGYPDVAGAIDEKLVPIDRPHDYKVWYCRKGHPADCQMISLYGTDRAFVR